MSLEVNLVQNEPKVVYWANITHNLNRMADAAGIYTHLWRPDEIGITRAEQLIKPLQEALEDMKAHPNTYRKYNPVNGWGSYDDFVPWLEKYLAACIQNKNAKLEVSR